MGLPWKVIVFVIILLLCGCAAGKNGRVAAKPEIDAFGVQLFSETDYRELHGVIATDEPCVRGYERVFDALDLVIGYGYDGKVRKITTRNRNTSICGVKPGATLAEGRREALQHGFRETARQGTFTSDPYTLTFLLDGAGSIFGVSLQAE